MGRPHTNPIKAAKAMVLAEQGYPGTQIAEQVGLPASTVYDVINGVGHWGKVTDTPVFARLREEQKRAIEAAGNAAAAMCLQQFAKTVHEASAYQAAGMYGIFRTHARLDAGEPTQISANLNVNASGTLEDLAAALAQCISPESNVIPPKQTDKS